MKHQKRHLLLIIILSLALMLEAPVFGVSYAAEGNDPGTLEQGIETGSETADLTESTTPVVIAETPEEAAELSQAAPGAGGEESVFATQRLILDAPLEEDVAAAGAETAVYYDEQYLLTYDSQETTEAAYEELVKEHGEENVIIDYPIKAADAPMGWGYTYMGYDRREPKVTDGAEVIVAVIDSGINASHQVFTGTTIVDPYNFVDDDGDGTIDRTAMADGHNHGTPVAGIIAESTPSNVKIMPLRVLDNGGGGSLTDVLRALDYAEEHGADIANMSLSMALPDMSASDLAYWGGKFGEHDILMICASGNDGGDIEDKQVIPAVFDSTVSVGSFNRSETKAGSSNYGDSLDFAAPGVSLTMASSTGNAATKTASGTSYACPYISAAAALTMAGDDSLTNDQVIEQLKDSCKDLGTSGWDENFGYGCPVFDVDITELPFEMRDSFYYTGDPVMPVPVITFGNGPLAAGKAFTLTYENNTAVGTAKVTVAGTGNFTGTITKSFAITTSNLEAYGTIGEIEAQRFSGGPVTPALTVTYNEDGTEHTLTEGDDYTVSYENNETVGTAKVTVTGRAGFDGTLTKNFEILPADLSAVGDVTVDSATYTGEALTPSVTVTAHLAGGDVTLSEEDYTLSYSNNVNAGEGTVTVAGKGNFTGTVSKSFTIAPKEATPVVSVSQSTFTWDGSEHCPDLTVTVDGEEVDAAGYTAVWPEDMKSAGEKTVVVTLTGNYTGTGEGVYAISPKKITPKVTLSRTSLLYNGNVRSPAVTVSYGGTTLVKGVDYTISKSAGRKNVGRYSIKVTMKGNYSGTKTVWYKIRPKATALVSVTGYKGKVLVKWKAQSLKMAESRITGYQIQTATDKGFTKNKKTVIRRGYKNTQRYVKGLKSGKTYYVRIRTYKVADGQRIYSAWSSAKKVKVK